MKSCSPLRCLGYAAILILAACGQPATNGLLLSGASSTTADRRVSPDGGDLLVYVAQPIESNVAVYKFPGFRPESTLTGFSSVGGLCLGEAGSVWVADTDNARLVEFAHGATQPSAMLADTSGNPVSCAVSAKTGTVAVINASSSEIFLYKNTTSSPIAVQLSSSPKLIAYDSSDDLVGVTSDYAVFEIPSGQHTASPVTIKGTTIGQATGVQFAGKIFNVVQYGGTLDRFRMSGSTAKLVDQVELRATENCVSLSIYRSRLLCPDADRGYFSIFKYPSGALLGEPAASVGQSVISAI
jgi:hypothetical protein